MTWDNYQPSGFTALLDAVYMGTKRLEQDPNVKVNDKCLVVIQTDGAENASRTRGFNEVRDLIQRLEATGKWSFLFIGQGPDAWGMGEQIGTQSVVRSHSGGQSVNTSLSNMATATRMYGEGASMAAVVDFMEEEHRKTGTLAEDSQ